MCGKGVKCRSPTLGLTHTFIIHLENKMTQAILAAHGYTTRSIELIINAFRDFRNWRIERRAIRETEKALGGLSDADLMDIGIARGDIYSIARKKDTIEHCVNTNLRGWV